MSSSPSGLGPTVGVTGGVAAGKSTVAAMLAEKGAVVIDFDDLAREVVQPDRPAWRDIVDEFGPEVLHDDRTINRKKLGRIVFQDPDRRRRLESFTHGRIHERYQQKLEETAHERPGAVVLAVIPLLYEVGLESLFEKVLVVYTPAEVQIQRLQKRDGISREEAAEVLAAQMPIEEKRKRADYVIDNSGDLADTRRQVDRVWRELTESAPTGDAG